MTRAVLDTNILISAILFKGIPGRLLELAISGSFRAVTSPTLLDELDEKLRGKFQLPGADANRVRSSLEELCEVVSTIDHLYIIKDDPDDDPVLECAIAGRADFIVSGDPAPPQTRFLRRNPHRCRPPVHGSCHPDLILRRAPPLNAPAASFPIPDCLPCIASYTIRRRGPGQPASVPAMSAGRVAHRTPPMK